jgi:hypothetical protein
LDIELQVADDYAAGGSSSNPSFSVFMGQGFYTFNPSNVDPVDKRREVLVPLTASVVAALIVSSGSTDRSFLLSYSRVVVVIVVVQNIHDNTRRENNGKDGHYGVQRNCIEPGHDGSTGCE